MQCTNLKVTLENIKGIKKLQFDIPVTDGVFIITGKNGCGKSTLMTALARINDSNIFAKHFTETPFDKYNDSSITYEATNEDSSNIKISFHKKNSRWHPTPNKRKLSELSPFQDVIYISTSEQRFNGSKLNNNDITPKDITTKTNKNTQNASPIIIEGLNKTFDSDKFNGLRYHIINARGAGKRFPKRTNKLYYNIQQNNHRIFSESTFSLGEKLVLNALEHLNSIKKKSLLLIDEIELALHPTAQINFFEFIEKIAKEKNLTVLLSTHSPSLIRHAKNRFFMEQELDDTIIVKNNCYPAYILRDITINEASYDYLLFVEDEQAKKLLSAIIKETQQTEKCNKIFTYNIITVGGWYETIRLMNEFKNIRPYSESSVEAFPDKDVEDTIKELKAKSGKTEAEIQRIKLWTNCNQNIKPLHITPELGVCEWLNNNPDSSLIFEKAIEKEISTLTFHVNKIVKSILSQSYTSSNNKRQASKKALNQITTEINFRIPDIPTNRLYEILYQCYVSDNYEAIKSYYKATFCHIINRKASDDTNALNETI